MSVRIYRTDDVHLEFAGPAPLGPIPHVFEAEPRATQRLLHHDDRALLGEGDQFQHIGTSHVKPQCGSSFAQPAGVTGSGKFTEAGQQVLFVDGVPVMCANGKLETCSDGARETPCESAVLIRNMPVLFVDDEPVLVGNDS